MSPAAAASNCVYAQRVVADSSFLFPIFLSGSQLVPRRKSPPPTFINLDDCKPILSTTTANTSTNSSINGQTAFVFTSSRTLRALQRQEENGFQPLTPGSSVASSPATPPTPSSSSSSSGPRHRAQLTLSQLTRHSEGAIDARSLIGPKMRAAGFVNLPHTLGHRSGQGSIDAPFPTSSLFPVSAQFPPTPSDPPKFPPIVFLNPTMVATLPMWEYQLDPQWSFPPSTTQNIMGHAHRGTTSNEPTPGTGDGAPSSSTHHTRRAGMPKPTGSLSPDSSGVYSSSGSSSTLVSSDSSPSTGLTSVEEADEDEAPRKAYRQDTRAVVKPPSPRRSLDGISNKPKSKKPTAEPTPTFATAPRRPTYERQYSLTELCDSSPYAWLSKTDVFAPPAPIPRSPIRTPSIAPSSISASISRPRAVVVPPPPHRRHHTAPDKVTTLGQHSDRHHRIASAPLRLPAVSSDDGTFDEEGREKKSELSRGTKARDQAKPLPSDGAEVSSRVCTAEAHRSDDGACFPPHGSGGSGGGARERGRGTRGKVLGASQILEERSTSDPPSTPPADLKDLEREITKDGFAALVHARRERDAEYARHVAADRARDRLVKQVSKRVTGDVMDGRSTAEMQKQRAHHRLRGKPVEVDDPSESEATMVDQLVSLDKLVE
ncbi:hypothetical protein ONZ51_g10249 [Trametes cubensis]|uniref:Uncharacterized protein n=1 Tax=Trametes cubensis TaxID=1111947 RepID=A0AAD7X930_9APHY|nr:hypothetical protein ONZ51_g10249 [Trametes cubensis]